MENHAHPPEGLVSEVTIIMDKENKLDYRLSIESSVYHITMCTHGYITEHIPLHRHSHRSYEIHYISKGKGILTADGRTYPLEPGSLFLTGPNVEHGQIPDDQDPMLEDCLYFSLEPQPDAARCEITSIYLQNPFWIGTDKQNLAKIIEMIREELSGDRCGHETSMYALLCEYVVLAARNIDSAHINRPLMNPPSELDIESAFLYHYRDITLEQISKIAGLSPRQMQRFLKANYGKTFLELRTSARMAAAVSCLDKGIYTTEEIADLTGYSSPGSFFQAFKAYYHMSVSEYRKRIS